MAPDGNAPSLSANNLDPALKQDTLVLTEPEEEDNICTKEHCFYCCDALYTFFHDDIEPLPPAFPEGKFPLFVTWNIKSSRPGGHVRLRGCIGNFEPQDLFEGLREYALIAARQDTRFSPIPLSELPRLECQVSLLTAFEPASSYLDWTIGKHGIYITFPHPAFHPPPPSSQEGSPMSSEAGTPVPPGERGSRHWWQRSSTSGGQRVRNLTATYLPEVAEEQGWTKQETVDSAIRKAGWEGRITEDLRRTVRVRRYQSRKAGVTWGEFVQWREGQVNKLREGA